jgi:hypothetical protein
VWQAAFQLVSYRSESSNVVSQNSKQSCFLAGDIALQQLRNTTDAVVHSGVEIIGGNCTLNLDDVDTFHSSSFSTFYEEADRRSLGKPRILALYHATIIYSGGTVIPINQIICDACTFEFRAPLHVPPVPGRLLTDQLLTADLNDGPVKLSLGV